MTTDLTTTTITHQFVNPATGEVIDTTDADALTLAAQQSPEVVGLMLDTIDQHIRDAQDARAWIGQFLISRMDMDATQTLHAGEFTLTVNGSSDEYETYDADKFAERLSVMVANGVITQAAMDKVIRVKREVSKSGLNSLRALRNADVEQALIDCTEIAARRRRVTVKRVR